MKKLGLLLVVLFLASIAASAAPVACTNGTLDTGVASTSIFTNGCTLGDKLFVFNSLTGLTASNVDVQFNVTGNEYHVTFQSGPTAPTGNFQNTFTLAFTTSVFTGPLVIGALKDQAFFPIVNPGGTVTDQKNITGCAVATGVTAGCLFTMAPGSETAGPSVITPFRTSIMSTVNYAFAAGSGGLNSIELDFAQVAVPEPMTLSMMGIGLLGLGLLGRKRMAKR